MDQQLRFNILTDVVGSEKVEQLKSKLTGLNGSFINLSAGIFAFEKILQVGRAGIEQFTSVVDLGDNLQALSDKTGIAASKLSQFQGAAATSNLSVEQLEKSLKKFSASLGDAGNEKFISGMKALGIQTKDANGKIQDSSDLLLKVSDKFKAMQDGPTKAAVAVGLFGKAGVDMIPLLNLGSKEIEKFGIRMGVDFPANADRFNDALAVAKIRMKENTIAIVQDYLPALSEVVEAFNGIKDNSEGGANSGVVTGIKIAAETIYVIYNSIINGVEVVYQAIKTIVMGIYTMIKEINSFMMDITSALYKIATLDFKNVFSGFKTGSATKEWAKSVENDFGDAFNRIAKRSANLNQFENGLFNPDKQTATKKGSSTTEFDSTLAGRLKKEQEAIDKFKISQKEQIDLESYKIRNYSMSTAEINKSTIALQLRSQAEKESVGWTAQSKKALMEVTEQIIEQKQALIDLQEQQKESYEVGARTALKNYMENLRDVAKQTETFFTNSFQNMEDALVDFVKSGQLNFKKLVDGMINDLIRFAVRRAMFGFLESAFSPAASFGGGANSVAQKPMNFATGGIMTGHGAVPLRAYASGGIATRPQLAMFGEGSTPEAYIPLPDGKSVPVSMKGGGGSPVSVVVNVNMETGQTQVSGNKGQEFGSAIAAAVKNQIVIEKRPGGLLAV